VFTAIVPFTRAFFHLEVGYNEGWNIYNAMAVSNHQPLYPAGFGWTTVNYPMLSFAIFAQLHRVTHDYLFTARVVSLLSVIACGVLVACIVRTLGASRRSATLAGLFCFAIFCAHASFYVGMDDPQLLAHVFFLLAVLVFLRNRSSLLAIAAAAFLFVIAGNIKQNPIDFPIAVLVELLLVSLPRALWFSFVGLILTAVAVLLNLHFGGPNFLGEFLAPRGYSIGHLLDQCLLVLGPIIPCLAVGLYTAITLPREGNRRIALLLLASSFVVSLGFSGGNGVADNAFFSFLIALCIILGLFFDRSLPLTPEPGTRFFSVAGLSAAAPVLLFVSLGIPLILSGNWNPIGSLHEVVNAQSRFEQDVAFLQAHPGPALCESLLECNFAGKPYVYDPFNATRFIHLHKLDPNPLIQQLNSHRFSVIQTHDPLPLEDSYNSERWDAAIRAAIEANYHSALDRREPHREPLTEALLYIPNESPSEFSPAPQPPR